MYRRIVIPIAAAACLMLASRAARAMPPRLAKKIKGHTNFITQFSFSAKGDWLASVAQDATVRLWKTPQGKQLLKIKAADDEAFGALALSPAGNMIAVSVGSEIRLYRVEKRKAKLVHTLKGHKKDPVALAFDANQETLASAADGARLWSTESGKEITTLAKGQNALDVKFVPGSGKVAVLLADGINIFDRTTFAAEKQKIGGKNLFRFVCSPDGGHFATVSKDNKLTLFNSKGAKLWSKDGLIEETYVAFTPNGKVVVAAYNDDKVQGFKVSDGKLAWYVGGSGSLSILATGGKSMVTGGDDNRIFLWRLR